MIRRLLITLAWIIGAPAVYLAGVGFWWAVGLNEGGLHWALGVLMWPGAFAVLAILGFISEVATVWWDWVRGAADDDDHEEVFE